MPTGSKTTTPAPAISHCSAIRPARYDLPLPLTPTIASFSLGSTGIETRATDSSSPKTIATEARLCMTVNSFTSAVLTCRKLLMHIAVEKGAPTGQSFLEYVEYLAEKHYVPPDGKGWVDHIRTKGNEANHVIKIMSSDDAKDLIEFSEMLLKFV
jgi:Domain of unknown function (DUF4145)